MTPTPSPSSPLDPVDLETVENWFGGPAKDARVSKLFAQRMINEIRNRRVQGANPGQPAAGLDPNKCAQLMARAGHGIANILSLGIPADRAFALELSAELIREARKIDPALPERAALSAPSQGPAGHDSSLSLGDVDFGIDDLHLHIEAGNGVRYLDHAEGERLARWFYAWYLAKRPYPTPTVKESLTPAPVPAAPAAPVAEPIHKGSAQ